MNLYVSNLAYSLTDDELRSEFAAYGTVANARVVMDRESGRSRGFGFVEIPNDTEAQAAMRGLEGSNVGGRPIHVVEARPKEERPQRQFTGGSSAGPRSPGDRGERPDYGGERRDFGGKRDWNRGRGERGGRDRSSGFQEF